MNNTPLNGEALGDLRKRLGVRLEEAATELGIFRGTIVDVEKGRVPDEATWREAIKTVAARKMKERQAAIAAA